MQIFLANMENYTYLCLRNNNNKSHENTKTTLSLSFILCGGEKPYIITFNSFEEFMSKLSEEDREGLLKCAGEPDNLNDLERIAQEKEGKE